MEKNKKEMKIIAEVIYWFAMIAKVCSMIGIIVIVTVGLVLPIFINKVGDVTNNSITYGNKTINYELSENSIIIDNTEVSLSGVNMVTVREIRNIFADNSAGVRILFVESFFVMLVVLLSLSYIIFKNMTKLFRNIGDGETPFTKDNVSLLRKIGKYMIVISVLPIILDTIIRVTFNIDYMLGFSGVDIMYILVIFALAYVFEYGYQLQQDVDGIL